MLVLNKSSKLAINKNIFSFFLGDDKNEKYYWQIRKIDYFKTKYRLHIVIVIISYINILRKCSYNCLSLNLGALENRNIKKFKNFKGGKILNARHFFYFNWNFLIYCAQNEEENHF